MNNLTQNNIHFGILKLPSPSKEVKQNILNMITYFGTDFYTTPNGDYEVPIISRQPLKEQPYYYRDKKDRYFEIGEIKQLTEEEFKKEFVETWEELEKYKKYNID